MRAKIKGIDGGFRPPTPDYFLCAAKESNQRKADPNGSPLRGPLRYSPNAGLADAPSWRDVEETPSMASPPSGPYPRWAPLLGEP